METLPENNPEIPPLTAEEQLTWLMEFGYKTRDISRLTDHKPRAIRGWLREGSIGDEESADRISSLFIFTRKMHSGRSFHPRDIVWMSKVKSQPLMRRTLMEAIAIMPDVRHQIAEALPIVIEHPHFQSSYFGTALTPPEPPEIFLQKETGGGPIGRAFKQAQDRDEREYDDEDDEDELDEDEER